MISLRKRLAKSTEMYEMLVTECNRNPDFITPELQEQMQEIWVVRGVCPPTHAA